MDKKYISMLVVGVIAGTSLLGAFGAQAAKEPRERGFENMMRMGVVGTVTAVNGNTITVNSRMHERGPKIDTDNDGIAEDQEQDQEDDQKTTTSYTVDATNATVMKNGTASTVANIAVGDTIMVQGTVTGTNVVAKMIRDGMPPKIEAKNLSVGNGQPIVGGTITAISGNTITITNKGNITYTIDVSNAKIEKPGVKAATVSDLKVGDEIIAQGLVNGTAVTASTVVDHPKTQANPGQANAVQNPGKRMGFFGGFGNFLRHLFGF